MAMRLSGLQSGMDTESVIQQLVEARSTKVTKAKNEQTKLQWKQDIWKDLNAKLKTLHSKLSDMRFSSAYTKKTTKVSDSSVVSVITGDGAVDSVQSLEVTQLAKNAYLTGGKVSLAEGADGELSALTKMGDLMDFSSDAEGKKNLTLTKGDGSTVNIELTASTSISDVLDKLKEEGLNASFDAGQKRLFISSKESGKAGDFTIGGDTDALNALGLNTADSVDEENRAFKIDGQDAEIFLNNARFTSSNNVFQINGLTLTALKENKGQSVTLTTEQDTEGIYDKIKDFFKTYNEVINEIDKLYNAESASKYESLSDEEKSAMSETEVEKYEKKIKDSLLRRDSSLSTVGSALKKVLMEGTEVNGKQMHLSDFGIETLGYFLAGDNEKNAYHINGDPDDTSSSANEDKLKKMIAEDPDTVVSFFSKLSRELYTEMSKQSKSIDGYRSFGNFYDDKKMKSDYDDYTSKIKDLEDKLADYEDKWYARFAKMETAMAKLQKNVNAVTSLLGGSAS